MERWSNRCRNGNCSVGDETGVLDCELPSLLVDPSRGGVRLICECQAKIAGSFLGSDEILRGPSGGSYVHVHHSGQRNHPCLMWSQTVLSLGKCSS